MRGCKTILVAMFVIVSGVLSLLNGDTELYKEVLTPKVFGSVLLILGIVQVVLRVLTTSPTPVRRYFVKK